MIHYANPDETRLTGAWYEFHFGETIVRVIERPDCVDDALEIAAECLAKVDPGLFSEPDYADAARECGIDLSKYTRGLADIQDADAELAERIIDTAETDHTYTESGWLLSWEWTVDEHEGEPFEAPHFDRFDIPEAHAAYQSLWHQGQQSSGYLDLCRAQQLIHGPTKSFDRLSENGQAIYRRLVLQDGR